MKVRHRLGKLHILQKDHDTMAIRSTNVKQFTMTWRSGSPEVIDVEGQVVNRDNGETFVRFSKGAENVWKVSQSPHPPAITQIILSRSHIRNTTLQISNHLVDFHSFSRPKGLFYS